MGDSPLPWTEEEDDAAGVTEDPTSSSHPTPKRKPTPPPLTSTPHPYGDNSYGSGDALDRLGASKPYGVK